MPSARWEASTTILTHREAAIFKIGKFFHTIQVCGDLKVVDDWYDRIFAVKRSSLSGYSPLEKRDASLSYISDFCMEPMAPAYREEGAEDMPVGRFHRRFGNHYQCIAWFVDEGFPDFIDNLLSKGIRLFTDGGGPVKASDQVNHALFTHPRDTKCQWELAPAGFWEGKTTEIVPGWSEEFWRDEHPLGIPPRAWHVTVAVRDTEEAKRLYANLLHGAIVHEEMNNVSGAKSAYLAIGEDSLVELAQPTTSDSLIANDIERCGEILHAVTFRVKDIDEAERFIQDNGVGVRSRTEDTFLLDPADTFGAVIYLTQRTVPGDPR